MTVFTHTLTIRADNGVVVGEASGMAELILSLTAPTVLAMTSAVTKKVYNLELSESITYPALAGYQFTITRIAFTAYEMSNHKEEPVT